MSYSPLPDRSINYSDVKTILHRFERVCWIKFEEKEYSRVARCLDEVMQEEDHAKKLREISPNLLRELYRAFGNITLPQEQVLHQLEDLIFQSLLKVFPSLSSFLRPEEAWERLSYIHDWYPFLNELSLRFAGLAQQVAKMGILREFFNQFREAHGSFAGNEYNARQALARTLAVQYGIRVKPELIDRVESFIDRNVKEKEQQAISSRVPLAKLIPSLQEQYR